MRDEAAPWRIDDLFYLEREINYWTGPRGYAACTAAVQEARAHAARHGMDRGAVLPAWAARYESVLRDIVGRIDPAGLVADCASADIASCQRRRALADLWPGASGTSAGNANDRNRLVGPAREEAARSGPGFHRTVSTIVSLAAHRMRHFATPVVVGLGPVFLAVPQ
jgi:hypothetical protein